MTNAPAQCDGTFSDVLADPHHPKHPRTEPQLPREFDEEALRAATGGLASFLFSRERNKGRFPDRELLEHLQSLKEVADVAIILLGSKAGRVQSDLPDESPDTKKYLAGLEKVLRWIWRDGKADVLTAAIRLGVATRFIVPPLLARGQQVDLLELFELKDKQSLNRHFIDFRDHFQYFDQLMRSDEGRERMRLSAAERRSKWAGKIVECETEDGHGS